MTAPRQLSPERLYRACDPLTLGFASTAELEDLTAFVGQERAGEAISFAVDIRRAGFNLFVLGPGGLGKHSLAERAARERAASAPCPDDWCYVNNFGQPHKPRALRLPTGRGEQLRQDMQDLLEELRAAVPATFESDDYRTRLEQIEGEYSRRQEQAFQELAEAAGKKSISLLRTPNGFMFAPNKDGEVLGPDEFNQLPQAEREQYESEVAGLQEQLHRLLHQLPRWRREKWEKVRDHNREAVMLAVGHLIDETRAGYADQPAVLAYLDEVRADVVEHHEVFRDPEKAQELFSGMLGGGAAFFNRYQVNLLSNGHGEDGAPVVCEDQPTWPRLLGRAEHVERLGALATDFTLIKPGALHQANGGYLLLDARQLLSHPYAWEGLKRALLSGAIHIESLGQMFGAVSTVSLQPEPIPLDVKVILFGERRLYYLLQEYDADFARLFKVAADFEQDMPRAGDGEPLYARVLATLARRDGLLPFSAGALARLVEHAARLAGDAEKLSLHMRPLADLMREADHGARRDNAATVSAAAVQAAIDAGIRRADRLRERVLEATLRGTVLIDTSGERPGQINGLSVFQAGEAAFGHPVRITVTTRLGDAGVIDIEREVELGGALHSKGVLILTSFLAMRFASHRPLALSASLVFEQSYGYVEGDSASLAELCALMSALAYAPIRQGLAVTGSVNQFGEAQAIGAVNEKIEGFYDLCAARGLSGEQGVLIPAANVKHLMLRHDVVEAARAGRFHVYAVADVDEAIEILTGVPAGEADDEGRVPEGSINYRVAARLIELAEIARDFAAGGRRARKRRKG